MDFMIPSMTPGSAGNAVPAQTAQLPLAENTHSADEAPPAEEGGFADVLSDLLGLGKDGMVESGDSSAKDPSLCAPPATSALSSEGAAIPWGPRSHAGLWGSVCPEEGLPPLLGMGGPGVLVGAGESPIWSDSLQSVRQPGAGPARTDPWPGHLTEQAGPDPGEPVLDAQGKSNLLGAPERIVQALSGRAEAEGSIPKGIWKQGPSVPADSRLASAGDGQERNLQKTAMPEEAGRAAGCEPDADPDILLSRPEAVKGAGPPARGHLADLPSIGSPGPGEADASWAGKENTAWKQDVPVDAHSRTPPSPASSAREAPFQTAQAASNGTFHVFRSTVHMQIHDEVLGQIRWHIHLKGEKISAEAVVETTRVQELLRSHQDVLEYKLNNAGVQIEDFEVSVDQGSHRFPPSADQEDLNPSVRSVEEELCIPGVNLSGVQGHVSHDQGLDLYA